MPARLRTVEAPTGLGTVTGPKMAALRVRYSLRILQTIHVAGGVEVPGTYDLRGSIELLEGQALLLMNEEDLILTLSDGRQLGFFVKHANLGDPRCEISLTDTMSLLDGRNAS